MSLFLSSMSLLNTPLAHSMLHLHEVLNIQDCAHPIPSPGLDYLDPHSLSKAGECLITFRGSM